MKPLSGKTALITGGSRSLGRETALRLSEAGADILFTYQSNREAAEETAKTIRSLGANVHFFQAGLDGSMASVVSIGLEVKSALSNWGKTSLDILVNNAGTSSLVPFEVITEEKVMEQFNVHYKSAFFLTQQLLPIIAEGGRIINISSGLARFTLPVAVGYAPMKAAVESLTKHLARLLGPKGITVNVVAPGALDTDFNKDAFDHNPQMKSYLASQTALGRVGVAQDVGGVIAFLCSHDAGWITGQRLEVSGGMYL